jgi:hypothetical protein
MGVVRHSAGSFISLVRLRGLVRGPPQAGSPKRFHLPKEQRGQGDWCQRTWQPRRDLRQIDIQSAAIAHSHITEITTESKNAYARDIASEDEPDHQLPSERAASKPPVNDTAIDYPQEDIDPDLIPF